MTQLLMRRPNLTGLPPEASKVETATAEDADGLAELLASSFGEAWDADRVHQVLLDDPTVERVYLVRTGKRIVATASARRLSRDYPNAGYLHWVASHPDVRGQGFGHAVTVAVLHHFAAEGLSASVLETDDERLAAITVYLGLGYVPQYRDTAHENRWSAVFRTLAQARLSRRTTDAR